MSRISYILGYIALHFGTLICKISVVDSNSFYLLLS